MSFPLATGLLAAVSALTASCSARAEMAWNFPTPVTPVARDTLAIHNEFMVVITVLFVVVFAIMIYSMIKHRKSSGHAPATFTGPNSKMQWFWAFVPFGILLFIDFVLMGIPAYHAVIDMEDTKTKADMVVKVTGLQWKWQYEYPGTDIKYLSTMTTTQDQIENREAKGEHYLLEVDNPLVLPVGKKVRVLLTASDVIHTWWVPQFGVKRDAIPGFLRETWVKIETPGTYRGQCAELCGKGHGFMPVVVEALPEAEYEVWLANKQREAVEARASADRAFSKDELMTLGEKVYAQQCAVCHGPTGAGIPGAFPALTGSPAVNGPLLDADGKLITDSHVDRVLNGKAGTAMQAFKSTLSAVDLAAVITYERNALGNTKGDFIQPGQIKALMGGASSAAQLATAPAQSEPTSPSVAPLPEQSALPAHQSASITAAQAPAQTTAAQTTVSVSTGAAVSAEKPSARVVTKPAPIAATAPAAKPATKLPPATAKLTRDELIAHGKTIYTQHCIACHGPTGAGIPGVFPALTGSASVKGPLLDAKGGLVAGGHVDRVMNGKPGTAMMPFKNTLSDLDLAAVISFERNALGNARGDSIQPAQIQSLR